MANNEAMNPLRARTPSLDSRYLRNITVGANHPPTKFTTYSAGAIGPRYRVTAEFFDRELAASSERR